MRAPSEPLELSEASRFGLDLTRAVAAQIVLLGHAFDFFNVFSFLGHPNPPPQIQQLAVVVFFVLSGFLIARTLHRHRAQRLGFGVYLGDRAARIYSGLVPALLCIGALDALPYDFFELDYFEGDRSLRTIVGNLLHLQLFPALGVPVFGTGEPLWTLAIEWWLYVAAGAAVLLRSGGRVSALALLLLPVAAVSVVANLLGGEGHGIALTWLLGALAYLVLRSDAGAKIGPRAWASAAFVAAGLSALWAAQLDASHPAKAFDRGLACGLGLCFLAAMAALQQLAWRPSEALRRAVGFVAGYSYTLYLVHFSLLTVFYEWRGELPDACLLALALVSSNVLAAALAVVGEKQRARVRRWIPLPRDRR